MNISHNPLSLSQIGQDVFNNANHFKILAFPFLIHLKSKENGGEKTFFSGKR
jgi:hypothetical protein